MNRLIATTAVALVLGLAPALAADDASTPNKSDVSPQAANEATVPESGSADTSTGAAQQSSAPPSSDAAMDNKSSEAMPSSGNADQSAGAKEQSSAPPGSSAADKSKPNPTIGADSKKPNQESDSSTE